MRVMQMDKFHVELQQAQQNALDESIDTQRYAETRCTPCHTLLQHTIIG